MTEDIARPPNRMTSIDEDWNGKEEEEGSKASLGSGGPGGCGSGGGLAVVGQELSHHRSLRRCRSTGSGGRDMVTRSRSVGRHQVSVKLKKRQTGSLHQQPYNNGSGRISPGPASPVQTGLRRASRPSISSGMLGVPGALLNPSENVTTMGAVNTDSILQDLNLSSPNIGLDNNSSRDDISHRLSSECDPLNFDGVDIIPCNDVGMLDSQTAPSLQAQPLDPSRLETLFGYEDATYNASDTPHYITPPLQYALSEPDTIDESYSKESTYINKEDIRDSLLKFASIHCCYGKAAARECDITEILPASALHYQLETYGEQRWVHWEYEPFTGQVGDDVQDDDLMPPMPWDIECRPCELFHEEIYHMEVPNSTTIIPCHGCNAMGKLACTICQGSGYVRCFSCQGTGKIWKTDIHGYRHVEQCWLCRGIGRKRCVSCGRDGHIPCPTCKGYYHLRCYLLMTIKFSNHISEHTVKRFDVPERLVLKEDGDIIFDQSLPKLRPLSSYPDPEVCIVSKRLLDEQLSEAQSNGRVIMQRQRLRAIPVMKGTFVWQDLPRSFWIYGKDKAVFCPEYPQKLCWGCTIL